MNELEPAATSSSDQCVAADENEQIIDELMHEYSDSILHLAYTYVKNQAAAEDLTQEILIKCYTKLGQFQNRS
ncbi:RNA polymerase factor sigma C, partial [Pseudomonas sp. 2822-15]|uniref:sigma factor n=1 Tax=Pseudomonas sp. 2822-15 TaxID=1712677 RepID=UPI000C453BD7